MPTVLPQWAALFAALPHKALGLAAWLVVFGLAFGALERLRPIRRQRFLRAGLGQDLGYYFLGGLVPPFLTVIAAAAVAACVAGVVPGSLHAWMVQRPAWARVLAMVVVGDLAFYWAHRWAHELPALWRLHAIHHSPDELDWLVNTRAHPLDLVFARAVSAVPLLVLGLGDASPAFQAQAAAAFAITTAWAFFVHANLRWRFGWLEQLVATPAFHHWHHADETPECLDKNYAALFPWIDRLFGTFHLPRDRFPASYGADRPLPAGLAGQLWSPFAHEGARPARRGVDSAT